jgi:hypothetical protein
VVSQLETVVAGLSRGCARQENGFNVEVSPDLSYAGDIVPLAK